MKKSRVVYGFLGKDLSSGKFNKSLVYEVMDRLKMDSAAFMEQTHSSNLCLVSKKEGLQSIKDTDGILTEDSSFLLIGTFADCTPVYYYHKDSRFVALVHSGWKGTQKGIAIEMLQKIFSLGYKKEEIQVNIGPSVAMRSYPVGEEFLDYFPGTNSFQRFGEKLHFHVAHHIYHQLLKYLGKEQIEFSKECTFENLQYHSYRREGALSGRNVGYIMIEEPTLQKR